MDPSARSIIPVRGFEPCIEEVSSSYRMGAKGSRRKDALREDASDEGSTEDLPPLVKILLQPLIKPSDFEFDKV